jgi:putative sigma-54 modulation protein
MNISLVGRHVELTDAIKQHLNNSIETLKKFHLDIISVTVVASANERKGKVGISVEFTINLAGKNSVVIKQNDSDLYAATDIAIERAQKALRRMHDREVDHHKIGLNEVKAQSNGNVDIHREEEALEDEIVPVELELYKPRETGDVLEELKENGKLFSIFLDHDGKTRVLYKRNDGRFGLY